MPSIEKMVQHALNLANDDYHGYSWADRWGRDRDCSSTVYDAAEEGGYGVGRGPDKTRYTGTMIADFTAVGFTCYRYDEFEEFRGCILLRDPWGPMGHTEIYLGDGLTVGAHIAETGDVYGEPGDQTGNEISVAPNPEWWDYILVPPPDGPEYVSPYQDAGVPLNNAGIWYQTHCQNLGWCDPVRDGQQAGTTGFALRAEAIAINPPPGWKLRVKLHLANIGWVTYDGIVNGNTVVIGTTGQLRQIEEIIIEVVERPDGDNRKLYFQVHQQNVGWKAWTEEGYASGSNGENLRLEAIRIKIE